jgi:hypothetical protein
VPPPDPDQDSVTCRDLAKVFAETLCSMSGSGESVRRNLVTCRDLAKVSRRHSESGTSARVFRAEVSRDNFCQTFPGENFRNKHAHPETLRDSGTCPLGNFYQKYPDSSKFATFRQTCILFSSWRLVHLYRINCLHDDFKKAGPIWSWKLFRSISASHLDKVTYIHHRWSTPGVRSRLFVDRNSHEICSRKMCTAPNWHIIVILPVLCEATIPENYPTTVQSLLRYSNKNVVFLHISVRATPTRRYKIGGAPFCNTGPAIFFPRP